MKCFIKRVAHLRVASSKKCQHHPELTGAASWFQSVWKVYLVTTILVDKMVSLCAGVLNESKWKWLKANARFGLCPFYLCPFYPLSFVCMLYAYVLCVRWITLLMLMMMMMIRWWWRRLIALKLRSLNVSLSKKTSFTLLYNSFIYFSLSDLHWFIYLKRKWHTLINRFRWIEFRNPRS